MTYVLREKTEQDEIDRIVRECAVNHQRLSDTVLAVAIKHAITDAISAMNQHRQLRYQEKRAEWLKQHGRVDNDGKKG